MTYGGVEERKSTFDQRNCVGTVPYSVCTGWKPKDFPCRMYCTVRSGIDSGNVMTLHAKVTVVPGWKRKKKKMVGGDGAWLFFFFSLLFFSILFLFSFLFFWAH